MYVSLVAQKGVCVHAAAVQDRACTAVYLTNSHVLAIKSTHTCANPVLTLLSEPDIRSRYRQTSPYTGAAPHDPYTLNRHDACMDHRHVHQLDGSGESHGSSITISWLPVSVRGLIRAFAGAYGPMRAHAHQLDR